jgi:hypothetical protein
VLAELRRDVAQRSKLPKRAMRIFPHICRPMRARVSRKRLKELTVHHKDHNHKQSA